MSIRSMFPARAVEAMHARLASVADDFGLPFTPPDHAPNTKRALALSELARRRGVLDTWRPLVMDAHWVEGRDIEDREVLGELADRAGLGRDEALAFLEADEVPALLRAQRAEAARWGVTGIPTWFMLPAGWQPSDGVPETGPRPLRVVGCQPREVVEQAARLAGATITGNGDDPRP